jgi:hypothetical protein
MIGYTRISRTEYYLSGGVSNPRLVRTTRPGTGIAIYWKRNRA